MCYRNLSLGREPSWIDCNTINSLTGTSPNITCSFESLVTDPDGDNYGNVCIRGKFIDIDITVGNDVNEIVLVEKKGIARDFARSEDVRKNGLLMLVSSGIINKSLINLTKYIWQEVNKRTNRNKPVVVAPDQNYNGLLSGFLLLSAGVDVVLVLGRPETTEKFSLDLNKMKKLSKDSLKKLDNMIKDAVEKKDAGNPMFDQFGKDIRHEVSVNVDQLCSSENPTTSKIILDAIGRLR